MATLEQIQEEMAKVEKKHALEIKKVTDTLRQEMLIMSDRYDEEIRTMMENAESYQREIRVLKEKGSSEGMRRNMNITTKKSFSGLPKYGGKADEYDDWKFKMKTFLHEEKGYQELLQAVDKLTTRITDNDINEIFEKLTEELGSEVINREHMNQQLYQALSLNLYGPALSVIKNLEKEMTTNGLKGWWKIGYEVSSMTAQRMNAMSKKVLQPKRVKKYNDVNAAIEEWEIAMVKYEEATKAMIPDQTKMFSVQQIVPEDLEKDILKSNTIHNYADTRQYVTEQVALRRDIKNLQTGPVAMDLDSFDMTTLKDTLMQLVGSEDDQDYQCYPCDPSPSQEGENKPMQKNVDSIMEILSFIKGAKGQKGGGKGKGQFDGTCHYCGIYGHRINECRKKDWDVQNGGKAKGKGANFQKGFGGEKGFGKGGKKGGSPKGWGKGAYAFESFNQPAQHWGSQAANPGGNYGKNAWSLALEVVHPQPPPGLPPPTFETKNKFETLSLAELNAEKAEDEYEEAQRLYGERFPQIAMQNYSKKSVRMSRMPKDAKPLNLLYSEAPLKELHPAIGEKTVENGWRKVKGVMDSGATESVAPLSMCPNYRTYESKGSRAGQKYATASGDLLENLGEQFLDIETEDGNEGEARYQKADVAKPLNSVSEICDAGGPRGQQVIFGRNGGAVVNLDTGRITAFAREDGIYTFEFWVKPAPEDRLASGFPRQGS